jgi:DNA-binding transcriptional MerR regulator
VRLSLAEIGEILDLYEADENGAQQAAKSLKKFRERITAFEQQKRDIDAAIEQLQAGIAAMEAQLTKTRPDLLPKADQYDQTMRSRLGDLERSGA